MARDKHHITTAEEYQRYLKGDMSPGERHAFEKKMLNDAFESEALDGLSTVEPDAMNEDLSSLKAQLNARYRRSHTALIWRAAAAVTLLAAFSFAIYFILTIDDSSEVAQSKGPERDTAARQEFDSAKTTAPMATGSDQDSLRQLSYVQEEELLKEQQVQAARKAKGPAQAQDPAADQVEELADEVAAEVADEEILLDRAPVTEVIVEEAEPAADIKMEEAEPAADIEFEVTEPAAGIEVHEVPPAALPSIEKEETVEAPIAIEPAGKARRGVVSERVAPTEMDQSNFVARIKDVRTVTGTITAEEDNVPVPGVNVLVKGSSIGTVTDFDGNYSIDVPADEEATLVYSYIGLDTEERKVKDQENIDVSMESDLQQLAEIVVTAEDKRRRSLSEGYSYTPPRPKGGDATFKEYVKEHIRYPASGVANQVKGIVKLRFTVSSGGRIGKLTVIKSLGLEFDQEAIRLIKEGPKWEPAMENDRAIAKYVTVRIRFRPPE